MKNFVFNLVFIVSEQLLSLKVNINNFHYAILESLLNYLLI
jgi:hypothetical protein